MVLMQWYWIGNVYLPIYKFSYWNAFGNKNGSSSLFYSSSVSLLWHIELCLYKNNDESKNEIAIYMQTHRYVCLWSRALCHKYRQVHGVSKTWRHQTPQHSLTFLCLRKLNKHRRPTTTCHNDVVPPRHTSITDIHASFCCCPKLRQTKTNPNQYFPASGEYPFGSVLLHTLMPLSQPKCSTTQNQKHTITVLCKSIFE